MYILNHYSKSGVLGSLKVKLENIITDVDVDKILSSMINNIIKRQLDWVYLRKSSDVDMNNISMSLSEAISTHSDVIEVRKLVELVLSEEFKMYYFNFSNIIVIVDGCGTKNIFTLVRNTLNQSEILVNELFISNDAMIQLVSELRVEAKMISRLFDATTKE